MAVADVRAILFDFAPEFETAVPAEIDRVDRFIGYAAAELDAAAYAAAEVANGLTADTWFNRANAMLAAHLLTVRARSSSASGAVQSESVGDLSVTYATPATAGQDLDATSYGVEYQRFRRNVFEGAYAI